MEKTIYPLIIFTACSLASPLSLAGWISNGNEVYITSGNVGIGITTPQTLLDVTKNMVEPTVLVNNPGNNGGATFRMKAQASGADWKFKATQFGGFKIRDQSNLLDVIQVEKNSAENSLYIAAGGNVGIGTNVPMSTLAVNGRIRAKEIEVTLSGWPDYVFTKNYALKPLAEVEAFIDKNHHLPNVPSANEVLKNGSNLGEMDTILLRKIEELTLYIMQLKTANEQLCDRIKTHENK